MNESQQEWLVELFERDLNRLIEELDQFENEDLLWLQPSGIKNSAGNLSIHICGNLQHFVGHILGKSGYIRQRDKEFSDKHIPLSNLKEEIIKTKEVLSNVVLNLSDDDLKTTFPLRLWNKSFATGFFLIHLHSHLNYHLGQINYFRRLL